MRVLNEVVTLDGDPELSQTKNTNAAAKNTINAARTEVPNIDNVGAVSFSAPALKKTGISESLENGLSVEDAAQTVLSKYYDDVRLATDASEVFNIIAFALSDELDVDMSEAERSEFFTDVMYRMDEMIEEDNKENFHGVTPFEGPDAGYYQESKVYTKKQLKEAYVKKTMSEAMGIFKKKDIIRK